MAVVYHLLKDANRLARIAAAPIHQCLVPAGLFQAGIGNLLISRQLESGELAIGAFLVDTYCLGVKDVFVRIVFPYEYDQFLEGMRVQEDPQPVAPAYFRKLIEDSVAYAQSAGVPPHPDYEDAKQIFGAIDSAECTEQFEFGKDGKPFYVNGPNDTLARQKQILQTLEQHCGPGGYDYLMLLDTFGGMSLSPGMDFDDDEDWEDEEETGEDDETAGDKE